LIALDNTHVPVSEWIASIKKGDEAALGYLWQHYFVSLANLARRQLSPAYTATADEFDIAQSAMLSFYLAAKNGRYPDLHDRHGLWKLLLSITLCKLRALVRKERRRREILQREFAAGTFRRAEPTAACTAELADQVRCLMKRLDDDLLCEIAAAKLNGASHREIAVQTRKSLPTVERKLRRIRAVWASVYNSQCSCVNSVCTRTM
jgi:DNA-directed RNA polymerase specialized sigma24 family protein